MTAMAMTVNGGRLFAWCDGSEWNPHDGYSLTGLRSKIVILQHLPCLLVYGGNVGVAQILLGEHAHRWRTFDEMVECFPEAFTLAYRAAVERLAGQAVASCIMFGGWSVERQRMEAYEATLLADHEGAADLQPNDGFMMRPEVSEEALRAAGMIEGDELSIGLDQVPDMIELARHQPERSHSQTDEMPDLHIVAGFIQGASLTHHEGRFVTATEILRRWDDPFDVPLIPGEV